jgi:hypothetical protein
LGLLAAMQISTRGAKGKLKRFRRIVHPPPCNAQKNAHQTEILVPQGTPAE